MARLPAPEDYGSRGPQASRGITTIQPDLAMGRSMQGLGELIRHESDKLEDVAAEDALNKLREKRIELSVGEGGFQNVRGGQVIAQKPLDVFPKKFDEAADAIGATLNGGRAQARYAKARAQERAQYGQGLLTHVANETNSYASETAKATVSTEAALLTHGYQDPAVVASSFQRLDNTVANEAKRMGLTGPALEAYRAEVVGSGHAAVLSAAITAGNSGYARNYLESNKKDMTARQYEHYVPIIKHATDFDSGKALGLEAQGMLDAGTPAGEVEKYLIGKATTPGMLQAAQATLGQLTQAADKATKEQSGGLLLDFAKSGETGVAKAEIMKREAFNALPKSQQAQVLQYMEHAVRSTNANNRALQSYNQGQADRMQRETAMKWDQNPKALELFTQLAEMPELMQMSPQQVLSYAPAIGPKLAMTLESIRKDSVSKGIAFKIPNELINEAIPEDLQKAKSEADKQKVAAFKGIVHRSLAEWKQKNPGKLPDENQQMGIVRSANKEFVQPDSFLWFDSKVKAYELKPMAEDFRAAAINYARQKGLADPTESQLLEQWSKQKGSR